MAKNKKSKLKTYKAPDAKFLVVVDPWPAGQGRHPNFITNVAAWFEFMLRDEYPDERVRTVYTQGTHDNIIIELSDSVDIGPYLGVHAHNRFLNEYWNGTDAVSIIYEYDYQSQNDPARRNWMPKYPSSNYDITMFPFKEHYPTPTPAPPPPIYLDYAKRPRVAAPILPALDQVGPASDTPPVSSPQTMLPLEGVGNDEEKKPVLVKKKDPYEEEDDASLLLRSKTQDSNFIKEEQKQEPLFEPFVPKEEPGDYDVPQRESSDEVDNFLNSIPVKKEESTGHRPSDQLRAASADYQKVKAERDEAMDSVDNFLNSISIKKEESTSYRPSDQLRDALEDYRKAKVEREEQAESNIHNASLEVLAVFADYRQAKEEREERDRKSLAALATQGSGRRIKNEPQDDTPIPPSIPAHGLGKAADTRQNRDRSMTLTSEQGTPRIQVKPEPQDSIVPMFEPDTRTGVDHRQMHPQRERRYEASSSMSQTRDPRLQRREPGTMGSSLETQDHRLALHQGVHIKAEPREDHTVPPQDVVRDPRLVRRDQLAKRPANPNDDARKRIKTEL